MAPKVLNTIISEDNGLYLNNGAGQILKRNATGTLTVFATGISSGPYGLEIVGDTIYAYDGSNLKGYNLITGVQVMNLNLGATF